MIDAKRGMWLAATIAVVVATVLLLTGAWSAAIEVFVAGIVLGAVAWRRAP